MFVGAVSNLFCGRLLHREDYSFAAHVSKDAAHEARAPSAYWLLGFCDRRLEKRYLDQLAVKSITRIFLGYACYLAIDLLNVISWLYILFDKEIGDEAKVVIRPLARARAILSPPSLSPPLSRREEKDLFR